MVLEEWEMQEIRLAELKFVKAEYSNRFRKYKSVDYKTLC